MICTICNTELIEEICPDCNGNGVKPDSGIDPEMVLNIPDDAICQKCEGFGWTFRCPGGHAQ